jgi:hypothetical protein
MAYTTDVNLTNSACAKALALTDDTTYVCIRVYRSVAYFASWRLDRTPIATLNASLHVGLQP